MKESDKNEQVYNYLSNFREDDMKNLLNKYEGYQKQHNLIRTPGFLILGVIGIARLLRGSLPQNTLTIMSVIAVLGLLIWAVLIGFAIVRQKKLLRKDLEIMSNQQGYPFNEVRMEFNTLVKGVYSGPKI